jgi:hypothetical protein
MSFGVVLEPQLLSRMGPSAGVGNIRVDELGLLLEDRGTADAVRAADIRRHLALFLFPQTRDDLFLGKPAPLHRPTPPVDTAGLYPFLDQLAELSPATQYRIHLLPHRKR